MYGWCIPSVDGPEGDRQTYPVESGSCHLGNILFGSKENIECTETTGRRERDGHESVIVILYLLEASARRCGGSHSLAERPLIDDSVGSILQNSQSTLRGLVEDGELTWYFSNSAGAMNGSRTNSPPKLTP